MSGVASMKTVKDNIMKYAYYQITYSFYERLKSNSRHLILGNVRAKVNLIRAKIRVGLEDEFTQKNNN